MNDFAVLIAILLMVLIDFLVGVPTPKLHVPDDFAVSNFTCIFGLFNIFKWTVMPRPPFQKKKKNCQNSEVREIKSF